jgi:pyruvate formate lyase activating enzyme
MCRDKRHYPAAFVRQKEDGTPVCGLCPHRCAISAKETGTCKTRLNHDGELVVSTYGRLFAATEDPIEKKPLFHYRPGTGTFSVASLGCNLVCPFCQNHSLSRGLDARDPVSGRFVPPEEVVASALRYRSDSISFTYSEPILMFEYARDTAEAAAPHGIELVFVTNGQIAEKPAKELAGFIHAANVDLKCFSKEHYKEVLGGRLSATLRAIEILVDAGVWVEVTTLVIPGFNDSDDELRRIAGFIAGVNPEVPWHVSRFHGADKWWDRPSTPVETLKRARQLGLAEGLKYVYTGNLPGDDGESTRCPSCQEVVIERYGYRIANIAVEDSRCRYCSGPIAGRGLP